MSTIIDIVFGHFRAILQHLADWYGTLLENGLEPDIRRLVGGGILVALWLGSAFAAATIAELRGRARIPHFLLGIILPWIYPAAMIRLLPRLHQVTSDETGASDAPVEASEELPASHLRRPAAEHDDEFSETDIHMATDAPAVMNQDYFARIATDETGAHRGPFIFEFDDNRVLEVSRIVSALPQVVVVEVVQIGDKPRTVRCPYAKITICRLKEEWAQQVAPTLAPTTIAVHSHEPPPRTHDDHAPADTSPTVCGVGTRSTVSASSHRYVILSPGTVIGNARVIKELGRGGMAVVYRAQHTALDIAVAVKVLSCNVDEVDPEYSERFLREARYAAQIKHDNVVAVMDAGHDANHNCYYIVLEYISGGSVADVLRDNHPIDPDNAIKIAIAVASALEVATKHNIVHRDIKPANMMITEEGVIKLADLGIAKQIEKTDDRHLTLPNTIIGSPVYMSPEQINDFRKVDTRTDIYSLGVSLFHMLAGRPPYLGETHIATLAKVINDPIPNPCEINPDIPPEVAKVCMAMMAKFPQDRYQTPTEVLVALCRLIE